jgi:hypothetical protein
MSPNTISSVRLDYISPVSITADCVIKCLWLFLALIRSRVTESGAFSQIGTEEYVTGNYMSVNPGNFLPPQVEGFHFLEKR